MKKLCLAVLGLVAVWAWASMASAGPVVPAHIDAKAKWFGHVDAEAIRALKVVQQLKDKAIQEDRCAAKLKEMTEQLGMNPMEDILGATLYATQYEGEVGVALLYVKKLDRDKLLAIVNKHHPENKSAQYAGRTLHSWTCPFKKIEITGVCLNDTTILVGADSKHVRAAIDVFDGKKPGMKADSALVKALAPGFVVGARVSDVPEAYRKTTKCPVLRNCKAVSAQWSVVSDQVTGKYELTTDSSEKAATFKTIVDGLKAMGELRFGEAEAFKKLKAGLNYGVDGDKFTLTFTANINDVQAICKEAVKHHKAAHDKAKSKAKAKPKPKAKAKPAECEPKK